MEAERPLRPIDRMSIPQRIGQEALPSITALAGRGRLSSARSRRCAIDHDHDRLVPEIPVTIGFYPR
jgi:hypothetical protein